MVKVTVDDDLRDKFQHFVEPVELCDESGKVLAMVTPIDENLLGRFQQWEPQIDENELQSRERAGKWHGTPEVLAHLQRLEKL